MPWAAEYRDEHKNEERSSGAVCSEDLLKSLTDTLPTHSPPTSHRPNSSRVWCNLAIPRRFIVFFRIIKYGAFSFALHGVSVNRLHVIGCGSDADGGRKNRLRSNCNVKRPTRAGGTFAGTRQTLTMRRTSAAQQSHFYRAQTLDVCHDPPKELILRLASE